MDKSQTDPSEAGKSRVNLYGRTSHFLGRSHSWGPSSYNPQQLSHTSEDIELVQYPSEIHDSPPLTFFDANTAGTRTDFDRATGPHKTSKWPISEDVRLSEPGDASKRHTADSHSLPPRPRGTVESDPNIGDFEPSFPHSRLNLRSLGVRDFEGVGSSSNLDHAKPHPSIISNTVPAVFRPDRSLGFSQGRDVSTAGEQPLFLSARSITPFVWPPEADNFESATEPKYDLRPLPYGQRIPLDAFHDDDESGNFGDRRKYKRARNKRLLDDANADPTSGEPSQKKSRRILVRYGRWTQENAPIIIYLTASALGSPAGLALVKRIKTNPLADNWPDHVHQLTKPEANFTELNAASIRSDRLRDRGSIRRSRHLHEVGDPSQLRGHPFARGCITCFEYGVPCTLIHDEERWPCQLCMEEDEDCELIMEPAEKMPCQQCRKRRIICSFKNDPGAKGACLQCAPKGFRCIAGPKDGRARQGASLVEGVRKNTSQRRRANETNPFATNRTQPAFTTGPGLPISSTNHHQAPQRSTGRVPQRHVLTRRPKLLVDADSHSVNSGRSPSSSSILSGSSSQSWSSIEATLPYLLTLNQSVPIERAITISSDDGSDLVDSTESLSPRRAISISSDEASGNSPTLHTRGPSRTNAISISSRDSADSCHPHALRPLSLGPGTSDPALVYENADLFFGLNSGTAVNTTIYTRCDVCVLPAQWSCACGLKLCNNH